MPDRARRPDPAVVEREIARLRATGLSKWTTYPGAIGSFIAEADFGTAPAVTRVVREHAERGDFGYPARHHRQELARAARDWFADRYDWHVDEASVGIVPDVLASLRFAIAHLTRPGSAVVVPTPNYMPFLRLPADLGRRVVQVPGHRGDDGRWQLDLDGIGRALDDGAGLVVLTNPANPTGTVHTRDELRALAALVERHDARVWADEVHAPIRYDGAVHVPFASLSETTARHTVTATSASKAWNIPGLKAAQTIFTNPDDLDAWHGVGLWTEHETSLLGMTASTAAYREGGAWLDDLVARLAHLRDVLVERVTERIPAARIDRPQATYLAWLDLRDIVGDRRLGPFLRRHANLAATDGRYCGDAFTGYLRLNIATPEPIAVETVDRLADALDTLPGRAD
ncbi:aminotransferase class I/II-fold pyridoxal phosphate-dependent enzyme [Pseudoclavibacter chungangensis]|uniref:cysteine-S-conjugate beta-lyase n=1 Tax=Pseudoclavibacter chungangensis TaxID=587635 RepID=A0A7J5C1R5_9MICO|nr:aminotransferase class I/II-fold pyridoxal phosphate-dependent enzyme [Pseudoclavibacter chungangensis]KAB1659672.1 aminotransferase class I/II-fold pyridoxal phosphate-dependent enzyme [Pseudoclavibacter chungangensis]NYJ67511.1 cystathionine beta-lyase [Pseudoclavibacter chungangensis]